MQESDDTLWCLVCNTFLTSRPEANKHFTSTYHLERVKYITLMKRNVSRQSHERTATDESKAKKIHEIYKTPHDYIQAQCRMTTEASRHVNKGDDGERPGSSLNNRLWQKDEFPGLPPTNNRDDGCSGNAGIYPESKKRRNRRQPRKKANFQENKSRPPKIGELSKMADEVDHPPKKTFEIDKQPAVSHDSVISSPCPSVWGKDKNTINQGTTSSDYWGSSNLDNRFEGSSVSVDDDKDSWSVGEHKQQGHSVDYNDDDRDTLSSVDGKRDLQSLEKPRWLENQHQTMQQWNSGDGYNNRWSRGSRGPRGVSRGFGYRGHVQSSQDNRSTRDEMQQLQHMQSLSQMQPVQLLQPSQPMQQMPPVQQQMQPVQQQMQPVQLQMQPVQQQMQPVQLQMQPVQQQMQPVQQQMQPVQQQMQPVQQQMQPVQQQMQPVQQQMQTVQQQMQPVQLQMQPVQQQMQPVQQQMQPVQQQMQTVQQQMQPVQLQMQPVQQQMQPVQQQMQPVQQQMQPVQQQMQPVQQQMQPVQQLMQPVQLQMQPVQQLMQPVQQQMQPVQQLMQPVQQQMQPVQLQMQPVAQQMQTGQPLQASQMMQPVNAMQMVHHMRPSLPTMPVVSAPSIGQTLREAGAKKSQKLYSGDFPKYPLARPPPSPSKGQVQPLSRTPPSPSKGQTQPLSRTPPSPSKGQAQKEVASKPVQKSILESTSYFGSNRWSVPEVPDDVTSIYVRNPDVYDEPDEDLKKFFSVFGEVVSVIKPSKKSLKRMTPNRKLPSMIVNFRHSSAVRAALKKTLFLAGKFTPVNPVLNQGQHFKNPKIEKANAPVDIYDLQEIGRPGLNFDEALDLFKGLMNQDPDLEAKQQIVCRDLEATFGHLLPGVEAKLFGSSQIGLRLKDSDTDIFMDCPSGQPPRNFVQKYGYLMFDNKLFENVVKIAFARVPIVTFNHVETGLLCDVTFLNKLGLKNSQMLKFLLLLDPRIKDLALIVKYWAKVHELSGVGNYSNYALTIMVLFYLQQLDEPLVPSIYLLQQLASKKETCESWECSFCDDISRLPTVTNKLTTKELLLGFFDYWATFDYATYVACPLLGKRIEKSAFKDFNSLPDELERYKRHAIEVEVQMEANKQLETAVDKEKQDKQQQKHKNKPVTHWYEKTHALNVDYPVCVQDSFDLSYNITRMIKSPLLARFQWLCEYARDEVLTKMTDKVLLNLFLPPTIKPPDTVSQEFTRQKDVHLDEFKVPGVSVAEDRYKAVWFMVVRLTVVYVLTKLYGFELEMDDSNETKAIVSSENLGLTDKVYRSLCMKMKGYGCVLGMRNFMRKSLVPQDDTFTNECIVSRAIVEFKTRDLVNSGAKSDKYDKQLAAFTMKMRFFCFPDEVRPRLMVQFINCKSSQFIPVLDGLKGLFCSNFQRSLIRMLAENNFSIDEYVNSGGGEWNDFGLFFENFIRECNEKSKAMGDDPRYAIKYKNSGSKSKCK